MKNVMLLLCSLLTTITFAQNFPGKEVQLLKGKELKVLPLKDSEAGLGYKGFYTDPEIRSVYNKGSRYTNTAALVGKTFKVVDYKPRYTNYVLTLESPETGIIYYDYNTCAKKDFVFNVIGGIQFPEGYFCNGLEKGKKWISAAEGYVDEIHTPFIEDVCLFRTADDQFKLRVAITTTNFKKKDIKGVTLELENGEKLSFPDAVIDVTQVGANYNLTTRPRIKIDDSTLEKLQKSKIVRKIIGTYNADVNDGDMIMEYIKCLAANKKTLP
ncbi:MAG: hypothetical protein DI539_00095 [Flavobacterium psychrophilum]|nr:MAG: hypothetical protein DI539_00095 [Flavobacterium psychrophilum]